MLLALDVGNTNITLGVFDGEELLFVSRMATDASRMEDQYAIELRTSSTCTGCAGPTSPGQSSARWCPSSPATWQTGVEKLFSVKPLIVSYETVKGFLPIAISQPETTGPDLIAGCAGAKAFYSCPCIVIDMGTATTLVAMDKEGAMVGGAIVPRDGCLFGRPHPAGGAALLGEPGTSRPRGGPGHRGVPPVRGAVRRRRHAGRPLRPHGGRAGLPLPG